MSKLNRMSMLLAGLMCATGVGPGEEVPQAAPKRSLETDTLLLTKAMEKRARKARKAASIAHQPDRKEW